MKSLLGWIYLIFCKILFNKKKQISNNILLINTDQIGDIVITFNLLNSIILNKKYDNIYYLIDERYTDLLSNLDIKIIKWNKTWYRRNIKNRLKFLKELNVKYSFHTCINLTDQRGITTEELVLASNATKNITLNKNSLYISSLIINRLNKFYNYISSELSLYQKHKDIINRLGINYIENSLHSFKEKQKDEYILIAPLASKSFKSWDKSKYKILINKLSTSHKVILIGSADQAVILEELRLNDNIINNAGKYSLYELHELIHYCKLFIGNDSGLTHLALHYNKKVIANIGMASKNIYYKEKHNAKYLYEDFNCSDCRWFCKKEYACIKMVKVEKVYNSCIELLNADF